ncbi:MAG: protein-disulfide reductase DsbD N-terminal domain-containing protein [Myxococcota bacterium]
MRNALPIVLAMAVIGCRADSSPTRTSGAALPDFTSAFRYDIQAVEEAIVVNFELDDGFHVYTVGESVGKPLKLELDDESPIELAGPVQYPVGESKDLPIGRSVIVEGSGQIRAPIAFPSSVRAKSAPASGRIRYQVCTHDACDRPRINTFEVTVPRPS